MLESCAYTMTRRHMESHKLSGNLEIGEVVPLATLTSEERKEKYKYAWLQGDAEAIEAYQVNHVRWSRKAQSNVKAHIQRAQVWLQKNPHWVPNFVAASVPVDGRGGNTPEAPPARHRWTNPAR